MAHKTKKIAIKEAKVDEKIIPLIKWMNSLEGVHTLFSCQGSNRKNSECSWCAEGSPYVMFMCFNQVNLAKILELFENRTQTEIYYFEGSVKYTSRFFNIDCLQSCIDILQNPTLQEYHDYHLFPQ